jgi:2,4-dienoyl-CoA reductase-like NADH-dependent reductase (Old Yellow Enzyme family)
MAEKKTVKKGDFKNLLSPIEIKGVEIHNRIVMAPMNTVMSLDNRGYVNEQILAYYAARAKGGCGLIITECVLGTKLAAKFPFTSNLHCYDVSFAPGLLELSETIHAFGARTFIQMSIGFGRQGHAHDGSRPPAPSAIPYQVPFELLATGFPEVLMKYPVLAPMSMGSIPYEMTIDEFANSCILAMVAQYDGIELHAPHGYLEHQFLSPRTNKRTDMYGGSLDNRMRFLVEVYLKVREAVGPDYIVGMRLSADEHMPDGFTHEEALYAARVMTQMGVDYVHLSDGSYEALKYFFPDKDGAMLDEAANFKQAVPVPVIVPSVHDPKNAEKAIASGKCDMVSFGRQMLADPEYGNKVAAGKPQDIKRCKRCNECLMRAEIGMPVRCIVNKNLGREKYMPEYWRPAVKAMSVYKMKVPARLPDHLRQH